MHGEDECCDAGRGRERPRSLARRARPRDREDPRGEHAEERRVRGVEDEVRAVERLRVEPAREEVDRVFGAGFAAAHPELVAIVVQTAASEAISEFRRQTEIHATVTATDTTQRITSALAALDAEHRAACDARRNSIQSDVARSTELVTEQFRQGLRAFFYSCLVAAVGAVEQHSQATREGLSFDPKNFLPPAE